jgi:ArsR family transcriptional regulator
MERSECCTGGLGELLEPRLFRALSDPNRLAILARLAGCCGPRSVTELATCCPVDLSVVSRHLSVLRDAGVVESTRAGKTVLYRARCDVLARTLRAIADALDRCCPAPQPPPQPPPQPEDERSER